MSRSLIALLIAQFLTAFADNAILFTAIAMVQQTGDMPSWYIPALQASFLLAYVVLAPWVGPLADRLSKPHVLILGNLIKALGVGMILVGFDALPAYAVVGLGAAIYSPAKYGILPELVGHDELVKANSLIEASTIAAIILGPLIGARVADYNITIALWMVAGLFLASTAVSFAIRKLEPSGGSLKNAVPAFTHMSKQFLETPRARFSMLGASLFWGASAVLRVVLVAWAPLVLATRTATDIAELTLFLAIGIIVGAAVVPKLIRLDQLRRARLPAYVMGILIMLLAGVDSIWPARFVLLFVGVAGGMFVVPINAALQDIGHRSIGSGKAVAIQNFFQNLAMMIGVGIYTYSTTIDISPIHAILALGLVVSVATWLVSYRMPKENTYVPPDDDSTKTSA